MCVGQCLSYTRIVSFHPVNPCVYTYFRDFNTSIAQRKLLGKSYCPMKDNDIFYCSFLRSQKDIVEARQSPSIEEIIPQLYDFAKHFQIQMGISR